MFENRKMVKEFLIWLAIIIILFIDALIMLPYLLVKAWCRIFSGEGKCN